MARLLAAPACRQRPAPRRRAPRAHPARRPNRGRRPWRARDHRRLCSVVANAAHGIWMNLGSAVVMPEVFLKAVAVARNFGHDLDGLVTVNLDKQAQYRSRVNVLERPSAQGIELIGHHEVLLPLLHVALECELAKPTAVKVEEAAAAA